jgi:hypothetical protein
MKKSLLSVSVTAVALVMCWGLLSFPAAEAQAQPKKPVALEGVKFDTAAPFEENLKAYVGKDIIVHLESGDTLQGYVKSVHDDLLHLEKLAGKDFYDALIRIDDISALEVKFRDMK